MSPERIQLSRRKGWRMPDTVTVARPRPWGNPFFVADNAGELTGKNLACWCKPGAPCHADVLLRIAIREAKR